MSLNIIINDTCICFFLCVLNKTIVTFPMNVYFKIKGEMRLCNITSLKRSAIFLL